MEENNIRRVTRNGKLSKAIQEMPCFRTIRRLMNCVGVKILIFVTLLTALRQNGVHDLKKS